MWLPPETQKSVRCASDLMIADFPISAESAAHARLQAQHQPFPIYDF
jgi:hypothetical protein